MQKVHLPPLSLNPDTTLTANDTNKFVIYFRDRVAGEPNGRFNSTRTLGIFFQRYPAFVFQFKTPHFTSSWAAIPTSDDNQMIAT